MHVSNTNAHRHRGGFTLVELLVVVIIITILAAFLVPAVFNAMATAEDARVRIEIANLAGALRQYKMLYGEFPPSDPGASNANVAAHLNKLFPRRDTSEAIPTLSPENMLYFYLSGYSTDVEHPITGPKGDPLFDFDQTRLGGDASDRARTYWPQGGQNTPYVYFKKPDDAAYSQSHEVTGGAGTIAAADNDQPFQIWSAGASGDYSDPEDNLNSFDEGVNSQ